MKAVDYLKAKARMAKYHCSELERERPEKAVEIVGKWAKEHPVKAYKDVLLERFPNAEMHKNGLPKFCPDLLFGEKAKSKECINDMNCKDCWNREYKESKDDN